ncbi:CAAX prenyl protease 1 homolog [Galendromus occidentalis]|uniref:CAAX prenyl protease n=1 Tax=Galendromus occidentalis TaxID=34638 RepID=A0AAJ7SGG1_9ACAR|nr:CAAX prenyl protease 1 homolog [Galendromus occidentalis]
MEAAADWSMHAIDDLRSSIVRFGGPYWTAENILRFSIAYTLLSYIFHLYVQYRQHRIFVKHDFVPNEVVSIMDQKTFTKSRLYNIDLSTFAMIKSTWGQITSQLALVYYLNALIWKLSGSTLTRTGLDADNEYFRICMFMILISLLSLVMSLPWSVYGTFVLEERHGFNKQTAGFFIKDKVKGFLLSQVLINPVVCAVQYILTNYGQMAFFYVWLLVFGFSIFLISIYPNIIAPMFDTFKTLPAGKLKSDIEALAQSVGFPLTEIQIVEGSKRSTHSNAYFVGLFKNKRIVLYDTLVRSYYSHQRKSGEDPENEEGDRNDDEQSTKPAQKGCTDEEVLAVLCHEIGHWKYCHTYIMMFIAQVHILIGCLTFSLFTDCKPLFEAFGFVDEQPAFIGLLLVFGTVYKPVDELLSFFTMYLSRRFEFQADEFVRKMHRASYLREALITLEKDNLSFPIRDWLDSAINNNHPTLLERLEALGKTD